MRDEKCALRHLGHELPLVRTPSTTHSGCSLRVRTPSTTLSKYSCGVMTQGQSWLRQGTLDVLVILFGIGTCTLDVLVIVFGHSLAFSIDSLTITSSIDYYWLVVHGSWLMAQGSGLMAHGQGGPPRPQGWGRRGPRPRGRAGPPWP